MIASHLDRLDVWHRNVPWSQAKQLRTVVETELSTDDVFDYFLRSASQNEARDAIRRHGKSKKLKKMAAGRQALPFRVIERNALTVLFYRYVPLPWYVTMQCCDD